MNQINKIKAFTFIEVTINLVIMSIIVSVVYYSYSIFSKQLLLFSNQIEVVNNLNQINVVLKNDVHHSKKMTKYKDMIKLVLYDNSEVLYEVINHKISRTVNSKTDYFETHIISHSFLKETAINPRVNHFTINYRVFNDTIHATYNKNLGIASNINKIFMSN